MTINQVLIDELEELGGISNSRGELKQQQMCKRYNIDSFTGVPSINVKLKDEC